MRGSFTIVVILLGLIFLNGCLAFNAMDLPVGGKVALIDIKGMIVEPDIVVADLERARKDKEIKAVVIRVDSPGGSVGASQEIFRTIKKLNEKKPVIASFGDFAASGGYYVAAGAKKIFTNEGTVTGSIGVRLEHVNAAKLFELIRLEPETLKSGKFKDMGTRLRALTPEEREILDNFLAEIHEQFKNDIAAARGLDKQRVDDLADGRIYTGSKAIELGLVDEIGGITEAVREAANLVGIKGEPRVVRMRSMKPWWVHVLETKFSAVLDALGISMMQNKYFMYDWKPF